MRKNSTLVLGLIQIFLCSILVVCGCAEDEEEKPLPYTPAMHPTPELVFAPHQMTMSDNWAESAIILAPDGASRIGMLVDLGVATSTTSLPQAVQVRGFTEDGEPLDWTYVEVTFAQDYSMVARHDPGKTIWGAQLRIPQKMSSQVEHITFSVLVPELPGQESESAGDEEPKIKQQKKGALTVGQFVKSRALWSAKPGTCLSSDPNKTRMAIHHTQSPPSSGGGYAARIRGIQAYHMDVRGWCDIGYHYLVTQDGMVWEGRPVKNRGAHVANHNSGNIGISFVGCFQTGTCASMGNMIPSQTSLNAAGQLVDALSTQYGIAQSTANIKGHGQHHNAWTTCPGDNLLSRINQIIQFSAEPNTQPIAPPDPGGGTEPIDNPDPEPQPDPEPDPGPTNGKLTGVVWNSAQTSSPDVPGATLVTHATVNVLGIGTVTVNSQTAYWELSVPPGLYNIVVSASGYESNTTFATVTDGSTTWTPVGLVPTVTQPVVPDPDPEPDPTPDPPGPINAPTVCYPGPQDAVDICFELTPKSSITESGYTYPSGAPASAQYIPPTHFLNLNTVDSQIKLAKNFKLNEFMQSWKGTYAVYSPQTVKHWQSIRSALGVAIHITSGFRSPGYNGGLDDAAKHSRHMYGDAADVTAQGAVSLETIKSQCNAKGADYVSVYTSHVHCDWRNDPLHTGFWASLGAGKPGMYPHKEAHESEAKAWMEIMSPKPTVGHAVFIRMQHTGFDEGIPWVKWRLNGPGLDTVMEPRETFAFVPKKPGQYTVDWEVAGYLKGQQVITVR